MKMYESNEIEGTITELMMEQIEFSNVVVLNKKDLVTDEQLKNIEKECILGRLGTYDHWSQGRNIPSTSESIGTVSMNEMTWLHNLSIAQVRACPYFEVHTYDSNAGT